MTLENMHAEWERDQTLDLSQPDRALRDIPLLHHKWWSIYTREKERYIKIKDDHAHMKRAKFEWYLGRLDEDERKQRGWPPQQIRMVRQEVDTYLASDKDLLPFAAKLELQEVKMKFLEDVIKHINGRGYLLKTYVDWVRFSQGA